MKERTRFAPSPTGMLHIGSVRTALYAYFLAHQTGGQFVLRIEDTDQSREVDGGVKNIVGTMHALGLNPDEGVGLNASGEMVDEGPHAPYQQSKRLSLYAKCANELLATGHAYRCFCTRERLEQLRDVQRVSGKPPRYDRQCLGMTDAEVEARLAADEPHVIRMRVPEGSTTVHDVIRGDVVFHHAEVDDQVLLKSDGFPTYHLAVVVDDHDMEITTVIRGEEWLPSTPKHLMLYAMFGWEPPRFAHVPLLLNADKSKLSKRQGDVAAETYLQRGYLSEAVINFVATLGYNPTGDREVYSKEELIELFDLSEVKRSGAIVNFEKLDWLNRQYLQSWTANAVTERLRAWDGPLPAGVERIVEVERHRATTLRDILDAIPTYASLPDYESALLVWKKSDARDAAEMLSAVRGYLDHYGDVADMGRFENDLKAWVASTGVSTGNVLWPLRIALSGRAVSPSPFELVYALGKTEAMARVDAAIARLKRT